MSYQTSNSSQQSPAVACQSQPNKGCQLPHREWRDCPTNKLPVAASYSSSHARTYFARSALCTAIASTLFGLGITPTLAAESASSNLSQRQIANNTNNDNQSDQQMEAALEALRFKKAIEQGLIDPSVWESYNQKDADKSNQEPAKNADTYNDKFEESNYTSSSSDVDSNRLPDDSLQQALTLQQQGYQMMTPEQIERELAIFNNEESLEGDSADFDNPIATLDSQQAPIGLDTSLDAANLPAPTNLDTLGRNQSENAQTNTNVVEDEPTSRPIQVSDAVSSGVSSSQQDPSQVLAQQERDTVTGRDDNADEIRAQVSAGRAPTESEIDKSSAQANDLNPDDYLPDYEASTETQALASGMAQASTDKPKARNNGGIFKRLYNRFFNGGEAALPRIDTTVYLQQGSGNAASIDPSLRPQLVKADKDIQPINNIKAALDDISVESVVDFTAALPRLRQTALDAARAVGYYDVTLRLRQPNADSIDVIIEKLGEPVRVESRFVNVRGEGSEQAEFQELEASLPPKEDEIFNHRVYKNSKAALEALSNTYGYFDQYWLDKSVDIILPDNTADISLVYETGERYDFDDVVFFTYDEDTGTLTRDPEKLPVEMSLLKQLFDFDAGDPFYRPAITKFSNSLSATRYFNIVNVEAVLPPDESNERGTLAFDNAPPTAEDGSTIDDDVNENGAQDNRPIGESQQAESITADNNNQSNEPDSEPDENNVTVDNTDAEDVAPIEFTVDEETSEKLAAIKQKAERLSRLPNNRVLDEQTEEVDSILGKISNSISNVAKKIFPDDEPITADEDFVPPTLAGRKTPEQVQESKKVPLYVYIGADKPRDAQVGIGYGTDTDIRVTGRIDYNLINKKGYQAGAEVELSRIRKNATVYGSRPWKHPLNDKLETRLTYEEEVIDQGEGNFDLSTKTLKAALARNIRKESGWDRSYFVRARVDELETGVDEAALEDLPVEFTSGKPQQKALLFGYGVSKTDTDNAINPTRGMRQYYGVEVGSEQVLSDTDMAIIHAGISGIYSFGEDNKHQVLGRFNTGYIWADDFYEVPYKLRFFAGGDQSIRGYDYESLSPLEKGYLTGGQVLAVGSAEYNYEFRPGFRGALFTDVGNAYDKNFDTETKVGVGVGIRWASPVGVVRVDVAAGVTEDSIPVRLHFFIGSPL
ncbi:autotransporter assembly complex protein TamA [Psychrobacter jeotgali]|uniref:autotransporter assembly complex protein TamA n=1 Tax=Psychrobacter jeotgali TaxID=179010 RepID=UPI00191B5954|nr:BamA/TamA family outer membrane protein [Psychrobacter jeotgali]